MNPISLQREGRYNPENIRLKDATYVILTHICDKVCPFCSDLYRVHCTDPNHPLINKISMSLNTIAEAIPKLLTRNISRVTLVGGEATLNPNFVKICELLHECFEVVCTSSMSNIQRILAANPFVDHWNFSIYQKNLDNFDLKNLEFANELSGTVTLSKLFFDGDTFIKNLSDLDRYIGTFGEKYQLKFSTLRAVNRFSKEREYVSWLESAPKNVFEEVMIFDGEVYAYKYRGYYIDRKNVEPEYSKQGLPTSLKLHPNGTIDYTWDEPWNRPI